MAPCSGLDPRGPQRSRCREAVALAAPGEGLRARRMTRRGTLASTPVLLVATGFLVGLGLAEAGARALERVKGRDLASDVATVDDEVLGLRVRPGSRGHDRLGFRNDEVPASVDLVAVGDSQTWGVGARRERSWPGRVAALTGRSVYNMSAGSYGPLQYAALVRQAARFRPRVVLVGFYLGSDVYDAYRLAYSRRTYEPLRQRPDLGHDTVEPLSTALWNTHLEFQSRHGRDDPRRWGLWLRGHTALGRLWDATDAGRRLSAGAWFEIGRGWALAHPASGDVLGTGPNRTVMTTGYRLALLDLDEPRIGEGLRIAEAALREAHSSAAAYGAHLLVVLIPTKESAYAGVMAARGHPGTTYARLVAQERTCRERLTAGLARAGIPHADTLPALRSGLERGARLYPPTTESHPTEEGYDVIAHTVVTHLDRLGWGD